MMTPSLPWTPQRTEEGPSASPQQALVYQRLERMWGHLDSFGDGRQAGVAFRDDADALAGNRTEASFAGAASSELPETASPVVDLLRGGAVVAYSRAPPSETSYTVGRAFPAS